MAGSVELVLLLIYTPRYLIFSVMGIAISFSTREKWDDGCLQSRLFGFLRDWCGYQTVYHNPHKYQSYSAKRCNCMVWQLPDNDNIVSIHDAINNCRCAPITIIRCERRPLCALQFAVVQQSMQIRVTHWTLKAGVQNVFSAVFRICRIFWIPPGLS